MQCRSWLEARQCFTVSVSIGMVFLHSVVHQLKLLLPYIATACLVTASTASTNPDNPLHNMLATHGKGGGGAVVATARLSGPCSRSRLGYLKRLLDDHISTSLNPLPTPAARFRV
jgi:hypothetical protein